MLCWTMWCTLMPVEKTVQVVSDVEGGSYGLAPDGLSGVAELLSVAKLG